MNVTKGSSICNVKIDVTEKQKQVLIHFMYIHQEFAKGNLQNNKKLDELLWKELAMKLNSTGCGLRKQPKEWEKTWHDWKLNLLRVMYVEHVKCIRRSSQKRLIPSPTEEFLLVLLAPNITGMSAVPIGGLPPNNTLIPKSLPNNNNVIVINKDDSQTINKSLSNNNNVIVIKDDSQTINKQQQTDKISKIIYVNKRKVSNDDADINNKDAKKLNTNGIVQYNFQHYCNIKEELLQLEEKKLHLAEEKFQHEKEVHRERMSMLKSIAEKIDSIKNLIQSVLPEYLD